MEIYWSLLGTKVSMCFTLLGGVLTQCCAPSHLTPRAAACCTQGRSTFITFCGNVAYLKSVTARFGGRLYFQIFKLTESDCSRNSSQVFWAKQRMSLESRKEKKKEKKGWGVCRKPNNLFSCADGAIKPDYRHCNHFKGRKGWGLHCSVHRLWSAASSCSQQIGTVVLLELFFFPSKYTFKSNSCK